VSERLTAYRSRIDRDTVVLVVNVGACDDDVGARANVEAVRVLTASSIPGRIVDSHAGDGQAVAAVNADGLEGCVLDVQVGDGGVG
jgi:hypothetical protein